MTDSTTFSSRSNAKRAAEKAIEAGTAPSIDYRIREHVSGRVEIVWVRNDCVHGTRDVPSTEQVADEIVTATAEADAEDERDAQIANERLAEIEAGNDDRLISGDELQERFDSWNSDTKEAEADEREDTAPARPGTDSDGEQDMPDRFPPGTRVIVQVSKRKRRTGAVDYRVDATSCRVKFDGPHPSVLCRYSQLSLDDGSEPLPAPAKPERQPRAAPSGDRQPSRRVELDMLAATGVMPTKPIMTSAANKDQYQPRFDKLEAMATTGDWGGVRGYEVKGINSYAKMVKQYRDRRLAAYEAQQSKEEAA